MRKLWLYFFWCIFGPYKLSEVRRGNRQANIVAKCLMHLSELKIIHDDLAEYQSKHCGPSCPNASNCTDLSFYCEMARDLFLSNKDRIEFYENDPLLNEAMEQLAKLGQHQPRWQND